MLTFQDHVRQAGRWRRRQFLRVGGLALGGLTLSELVRGPGSRRGRRAKAAA